MKRVEKQVPCQVTTCKMVQSTENYNVTVMVQKQVAFQATRTVRHCVPVTETVMATRYVAKQVTKEVPVTTCCKPVCCEKTRKCGGWLSKKSQLLLRLIPAVAVGTPTQPPSVSSNDPRRAPPARRGSCCLGGERSVEWLVIQAKPTGGDRWVAANTVSRGAHATIDSHPQSPILPALPHQRRKSQGDLYLEVTVGACPASRPGDSPNRQGFFRLPRWGRP